MVPSLDLVRSHCLSWRIVNLSGFSNLHHALVYGARRPFAPGLSGHQLILINHKGVRWKCPLNCGVLSTNWFAFAQGAGNLCDKPVSLRTCNVLDICKFRRSVAIFGDQQDIEDERWSVGRNSQSGIRFRPMSSPNWAKSSAIVTRHSDLIRMHCTFNSAFHSKISENPKHFSIITIRGWQSKVDYCTGHC